MSNSVSTSNPRRNKGRRKIEMKKMTNESNLQVTFSKRRAGLFKKASELCTLCGAQVALVVFSPADKAFSFGDPNVNEVIDRYQMRAPPPPQQNLGNMRFLEAPRDANVVELNAQLSRINEDLDIEKNCSHALAQERKVVQEHLWWAAPIEEINAGKLDQLKLALENLKSNVIGIVETQNFIQGGGAIPPPHFFQGGPSSSNNPLLQHMPPPQQFPMHPPPPQQFPMHPPPPPPPSEFYQNQPGMLPNYMFHGAMMHHPSFNNNNMGGFGPAGGFF